MNDIPDDEAANVIRLDKLRAMQFQQDEQPRTEPIDDGSEAYYRYHNWRPIGTLNFIDNINQFYAYNANSPHPIMHFNADGTISFISKGNFLGEFAAFNYTILNHDDPSQTIEKKSNMGTSWFNHSRRRNHKFIVFDPSRIYSINDERYNLWTGFDHLTPKKGDWSRFESFLRNIICSGNEDDYQFQIGALAHLLRHPEKKLQFATVLQGDKGIGKTFYAERIADLIGPKYSKILSQREKFFNRFIHLAKMLFTCLDEAFYVGNRNEGAQIKGFITGKTTDIEYKFGPTITVPNLCYLMLIGNPRHIVEATEKERRYHCLVPSEDKLQDNKYFGELNEAWDDHERDAFAHYALHECDLNGFNMYKVPNTLGLMRQKLWR